VRLSISARLGSSIGQHPNPPDVVFFKEGQNSTVVQIGGGNRRLLLVKLCESDLAVCIDEGPLIYATDTFEPPT
jgi:hypothetical protein